MQISTSVLPTLTAVTLMRFAAILMDRPHAHVKQDSLAMVKLALVSCCGVVKNASKTMCVPVCIFYILSSHLNIVENNGHVTSMV